MSEQEASLPALKAQIDEEIKRLAADCAADGVVSWTLLQGARAAIEALEQEIARLRGYVQHKSGCATSFSVSGNPEPFGITLPLPCSCGLNIDPLIPHAHQGAL